MTMQRRKSPRAPSISLEEALEKVGKIYDRERTHAAPSNAAANHMGYKSADSGASLAVIASLKYYGLLERPKEGYLAVSKDVEKYRFAPSDDIKRALLIKWLRSPPIFADLLDEYSHSLPSEATLKFGLIQRGFSPSAAETCQQVFMRSVDYARYFDDIEEDPPMENSNGSAISVVPDAERRNQPVPEATSSLDERVAAVQPSPLASAEIDRIPVRLSGGRRAWLEIPVPFFEGDKERLMKQIEVLPTDDDETT